MPPLLSVAIITKNEEANLPRTLASVQFADEIIVLDSASTDRTVEIARAFNATVYDEPWKGFAGSKNSAIAKCTGTWVLSLDADEELSPELQTQIKTLLPTNPPTDAYYINRRNYFLGRWIKHGGLYPDPKLRLFRRAVANFTTTPQSEDRPVHETIAFDGEADTLDYDLIHNAFPSIDSYIEHMDRYSTVGSEMLVAAGKSQPLVARIRLQCLRGPAAHAALELHLPPWLSRWPRGLAHAPLPRHLHQLEVRQGLANRPHQTQLAIRPFI
jgi:glycosyltransferase involved in cell wall biosynthesis